jgi:predicted nucleic-acid-binding protein
VLRTLSRRLSAAELAVESDGVLEIALRLFRKGSVEFADSLHVALVIQAGEQPWSTFDIGAAKLSGARLLAKA